MSPSNQDFKVLCVDDDPEMLEVYQSTIESFGYTVLLASDGLEAFSLLDKNWRDIVLVITDHQMPGNTGIELRKLSYDSWPEIPFMLVSGFISKEDALQALENKVVAFLEKPIQSEELKQKIDQVCRQRVEDIKEERELLSGFLDEAEMLLEEIVALVEDLESGNHDISILDRIFAIIHTIKGASGFFKPITIHKYSHSFEDFLTKVRNGDLEISEKVISLMYKGVDQITKLVEELKNQTFVDYDLDQLTAVYKNFTAEENVEESQQKDSSGDSDKKTDSKAKARDEVRVSVGLLDEFMGMSGEITVLRNMIIKLVKSIEKSYGGNKDILLLGELLDEMHKVNSSIQDKIVVLRKVPLKTIYRPIARVVRDLAPKLGKKIELEFSGEELKVDTSIAEVLNNSLVHMIRNCLDHGIELPEKRLSAGKTAEGHVKISAVDHDDRVVVSIDDDGAGIDSEKIKKKAIEKGLITPEEAQKLSKSEILMLIFSPGFSTAEQITDISGRGVGTDMLKGSVEKIGGHIDLQSEVGEGTRFIMHLPAPKSVLIINCLFVDIGDDTFAIPREEVVRLIQFPKSELQNRVRSLQGGVQFYEDESGLLPIINLVDTLNLKASEIHDSSVVNLAIIKTKNYKFVIHVDQVHDMEDTVVKVVKNGVKAMELFMGATFLGDGKLGLILNLDKVAEKIGLQIFKEKSQKDIFSESDRQEELKHFVLFSLNEKINMAADMKEVFRLEEFPSEELQKVGALDVIIYRNKTMPIFHLSKLIGLNEDEVMYQEYLPTLIVESNNQYVGFVVNKILNLSSGFNQGDSTVKDRPEIKCNLTLNGKVYPELDVNEVLFSVSKKINKTRRMVS